MIGVESVPAQRPRNSGEELRNVGLGKERERDRERERSNGGAQRWLLSKLADPSHENMRGKGERIQDLYEVGMKDEAKDWIVRRISAGTRVN